MIGKNNLRAGIATLSILVGFIKERGTEELKKYLQFLIPQMVHVNHTSVVQEVTDYILNGKFLTFENDDVLSAAFVWVTSVTPRTKVFDQTAVDQFEDWFKKTYPTAWSVAKNNGDKQVFIKAIAYAARAYLKNPDAFYVANGNLNKERLEHIRNRAIVKPRSLGEVAVALGYFPEDGGPLDDLNLESTMVRFHMALGIYTPKTIEEIRLSESTIKYITNGHNSILEEKDICEAALFNYLRETDGHNLTIEEFARIGRPDEGAASPISVFMTYRLLTILIAGKYYPVLNDTAKAIKKGERVMQRIIQTLQLTVESPLEEWKVTGVDEIENAKRLLDFYKQRFPVAYEKATKPIDTKVTIVENNDTSSLSNAIETTVEDKQIIWQYLEMFLFIRVLQRSLGITDLSVLIQKLETLFPAGTLPVIETVSETVQRFADGSFDTKFLFQHPAVNTFRLSGNVPNGDLYFILEQIRDHFAIGVVQYHYHRFLASGGDMNKIDDSFANHTQKQQLSRGPLIMLKEAFPTLYSHGLIWRSKAFFGGSFQNGSGFGKPTAYISDRHTEQLDMGKIPTYTQTAQAYTFGPKTIKFETVDTVKEVPMRTSSNKIVLFRTVTKHLLQVLITRPNDGKDTVQLKNLLAAFVTSFHDMVSGFNVISILQPGVSPADRKMTSPGDFFKANLKDLAGNIIGHSNVHIYQTQLVDNLERILQANTESQVCGSSLSQDAVPLFVNVATVCVIVNRVTLVGNGFEPTTNPFEAEVEGGRCFLQGLELGMTAK